MVILVLNYRNPDVQNEALLQGDTLPTFLATDALLFELREMHSWSTQSTFFNRSQTTRGHHFPVKQPSTEVEN